MQGDPQQQGTWYGPNGIHRGKHSKCRPCGVTNYPSLRSALHGAGIMAIRFGGRWEAHVCPHGNGCHVRMAAE
jgi:hypothetical protein